MPKQLGIQWGRIVSVRVGVVQMGVLRDLQQISTMIMACWFETTQLVHFKVLVATSARTSWCVFVLLFQHTGKPLWRASPGLPHQKKDSVTRQFPLPAPFIQEFPRGNSKPKKRLQENRVIQFAWLGVSSWGLESPQGNLGIYNLSVRAVMCIYIYI